MGLASGSILGPYEILSLLGAGGMGEVYRARDTRLGREVALKVLGEGRARDRDALERFEREARAASALNHPNIVTIYDIGRAQCGSEPIAYIAMELVEGQSLRQIISEGPVEMETLLNIAIQAAHALSVAHQKGIVHRDLKPENIMLTREHEGQGSRVKILDFGLAKLDSGVPDSAEPSAETTLTPPVTITGAIMGTVAYMSPEQARGRNADFRSDQFSFGAVLYEMATGRSAFGGGTTVETLAAVLRDDPETLSELNSELPLPLKWAIKRCLAKDPAGRYPSTQDLASDLAIVRDNLRAPVVETGPALPHHLPVQRTPLVGRDSELEAVKQLLMREEVRLVVLTGPGGTGKTRLAIQVAEEAAKEFRGGIYFVSLATVAEASLVGPTVAQALGVREAGGKPLGETLKDRWLPSHRGATLLVLDNFEHVLGAAPLVAELLESLPATKILVTSRSLLRLYGEHEFSVPPLSLPALEHLPDVETLAKTPAVSLFLQRAAALRPGFVLTQENMRAVAEICMRLDGLPLAIELAAARIKLLSPSAMLTRLESRLQWLTGGARDLPERQKTLRATLDWSYELLQPAEQKLFRRISVFASGCTLEAAEAVANAQEDLDANVLDAIASLVDKSLLLQAEQEAGETRFRMLETIREYALECLTSSGNEKVARRAHAAYYLILAEEGAAQLMGPQRQLWLNRFDQEHENFRAALDWLTRTGKVEWGLRLACALQHYWLGHASATEGRSYLLTLLNLPAKAPKAQTPAAAASRQVAGKKLRANALGTLSSMALEHGDYRLTRKSLEEALAIYRELDHLPGVVMVLNHLAAVERNEGNYAAARSLVIETTRIWQEAGDLVSVAHATSNLADLAQVEGDYAAALSLHQECLSIYKQLGDQTSIAWSLDHQGDLALEQGDLERARSLYEQALEIFRGLGEKGGIARALTDLGNLACNEGAHDKAQQLYAETLALFSELGETRDMTRVLEGIACATADSGKWERALRLAGAAAELRQRLGTPLPPSAKANLEKRLETARAKLTSAAAAKAWMEGSRMTPQAAVEYALAERAG